LTTSDRNLCLTRFPPLLAGINLGSNTST